MFITNNVLLALLKCFAVTLPAGSYPSTQTPGRPPARAARPPQLSPGAQ